MIKEGNVMPTSPVQKFIRRLRFAGTSSDERTDADLLEAYIAHGDDGAFESLVHRHGPMIFGVCCRVLGNVHDAADAFQATFLVLVRKAPSLRTPSLVGNWLHGVACRTAMRARTESRRRRARTLQVDPMPEPTTSPSETSQDLLAILDREIARLPEKYRVPLILFELEGRSRKDVARQLGLPLGTVASRLATARKILARRLTRHAPEGGAEGLALPFGAAALAVPRELLVATVLSARLIAKGTLAASAVSAEVVSLTEGVVRSMLLSKLNFVLVFAVVAGVVAVVAGRGLSLSDEPPKNEQEVQKKPARDLIPEEIQKERAMNRLPSGRAPVQAWAKIVDAKRVIVRQEAVVYGIVTKQVQVKQAEPAGVLPAPAVKTQEVASYTPMLTQCERVFDTDKLLILDMQDKPSDISELPAKLKKETLVLVSADGEKVDPLHLRLYKQGTLLFIIPPPQPAFEPPQPGMAPPTIIEGHPSPTTDRPAPPPLYQSPPAHRALPGSVKSVGS